MKNYHLIRKIVGGICIALGIIGLLLPIVPGTLFIVLGLGLFGLPHITKHAQQLYHHIKK
jgi:uncharacterized membrane protein YbaN (DUF454 family)